MAAFLDANVFLYAAGADGPYREPCIALLRAVESGQCAAATSTEVVQEVLHVVARRAGAEVAATAAESVLGLVSVVLPVERSDLERACALLRKHPGLPVRDAVHAATLRRAGIDVIVSADKHFDQVTQVQRVDPLDRDALLRLLEQPER